MAFVDLPPDVVEHSIWRFIPLMDLWKLQPQSKVFKHRLQVESQTFYPWIDALEADDVDFMKQLENVGNKNTPFEHLAVIAFIDTKINIMEHILDKHDVLDPMDSLLDFYIFSIPMENFLSLSDKLFTLCLQYIYKYSSENNVPKHLHKAFSDRLSLIKSIEESNQHPSKDVVKNPDRPKDHGTSSIQHFKDKLKELEKNKYNANVWIPDNEDLLLYINVDPDIIFPKLLSTNPSGISILVRSRALPDLFWLEKYRSLMRSSILV